MTITLGLVFFGLLLIYAGVGSYSLFALLRGEQAKHG